MDNHEKKEFAEYVRANKIKNINQFTDFVNSFENRPVKPARLKDYIKAFNELRK